MGNNTFDFAQILGLSPALAGAREVRALMATLNAGFTSVRECGGMFLEYSLYLSASFLTWSLGIGIDVGKGIDEGKSWVSPYFHN